MLEKNFQSLFAKWVRSQQWFECYVFELKITKTNTLALSRIEEHQLNALYAAKHKFQYHKISDFSPEKKPFDCAVWAAGRAELCIMYYKPRQPKCFYAVDIDILLQHIKTGAKSISEAQAKALGACHYLPSK